jgi:aminoglycoside/choline kinase family phosphotransferase
MPANAAPLYADAIAALVRIQRPAGPVCFPTMTDAVAARARSVSRMVSRQAPRLELSDQRAPGLEDVFERILAANLAEPKVFVHRDYHSRNLMRTDGAGAGNPGIIDFQDAVYGPISYDMVSLLKDAYIEWDEDRPSTGWCATGKQARKAGLPVARFRRVLPRL